MRSRRMATVAETTAQAAVTRSMPTTGFRSMKPDLAKCVGKKDRGEGPAHEDFAVGEVDHLQNAVDQRVAHGDQGVHAAQGQSLEWSGRARRVGRVFSGLEGLDGADHHDDRDGDTDGPDHEVDESYTLTPGAKHLMASCLQ